MARVGNLKHAAVALLLIGGVLVSNGASAQQAEMDKVKAANQAFYTALSGRDIVMMQKVWSNDPDIQNIGPRAKAMLVGWEAIKTSFEGTFAAFPELKVSMEPRIKIVESVAWVSGIEKAQRKNKAGVSGSGENLATSIFQKENGHWLMVYHHASLMPK